MNQVRIIFTTKAGFPIKLPQAAKEAMLAASA